MAPPRAPAGSARAALPSPPCAHNAWDDVRTRKGAKVLRCRECQCQWKLRDGVPRCIPFLHGECALQGAECAYLHVHKRKEGLDDRVRRFGADVASDGAGDVPPPAPAPVPAAEPAPSVPAAAGAPGPSWRWEPYSDDAVCVAAKRRSLRGGGAAPPLTPPGASTPRDVSRAASASSWSLTASDEQPQWYMYGSPTDDDLSSLPVTRSTSAVCCTTASFGTAGGGDEECDFDVHPSFASTLAARRRAWRRTAPPGAPGAAPAHSED